MSPFETSPRIALARQQPTPDVHAGTCSHAATQRKSYNRERDLPRLIRLWPGEVASRDPAMLKSIVRKLHAALRAERQHGLAGHWTYDLARHSQLLAAYRAELHTLRSQRPRI